MSVDFNLIIETGYKDLMEQIEDLHDFIRKIWKNDPCKASGEDVRKLEEMLRGACDTLEIINSYDFTYDRLRRHCYGWHPGRYQVECRLCDVQRLCAEESKTLGQTAQIPPNCSPPGYV